jgi:cAMP-specific phosphodiesterase 4
MNMAMRISDYGNPMQPHDLYLKWMSMIMEEFYQQGDIEDHLGMEETLPFMKRKETNPYACQLSFIEVIVEPMTVIWVEFLPDIREDVYTLGLLENKEILKQKSDQIPKNDEEDFEVPPPEKRRRR